MLSRRELIKLGLLGGASTLLPRKIGSSALCDDRRSPRTTPFVMDLPIPPTARPVAPFATSKPDCVRFRGSRTRFFRIIEEERFVRVHPELPPTAVWGYRDGNVPRGAYPFGPGPTLRARIAEDIGGGIIIRQVNELPAKHRGFGEPLTTVHHHGAHLPATSDGFPGDFFPPGESYDYCLPMLDVGFLTRPLRPQERPATLWYHDHLIDFTGPNVYRGLAAFFLVFDELDTGDERTGLRLPSGAFDVPLMLTDKLFARDGSLIFDSMDHDGFLGDKFLVNGAIQPRFRVKRRKYRFRFLNASNARFYLISLVDPNGRTAPFDHIATGGGLLAETIREVRSFEIAPAQREEVVIDFRQFRTGDEVFLENRWLQEDGRGPKEVLPRGPQILKFIVEEEVADPSRVPDILRPLPLTPRRLIESATRKTFEFERQNGAWAINGQFVDLDRPITTSPVGAPEIWRLINKSGGWFHPIHIHSQFMRVLRRNEGLPPLNERDGMARIDTVTLGPNDEVQVFFQFMDYKGPFVFHCHNLEHEDMFMMARFDVV